MIADPFTASNANDHCFFVLNTKLLTKKKTLQSCQKVGRCWKRKYYDNQAGQWIADRLQQAQFKIDANALQILSEALGNDLSKIEKKLEIKNRLEENTQITPELIEQHVGFVKTTIISSSIRH